HRVWVEAIGDKAQVTLSSTPSGSLMAVLDQWEKAGGKDDPDIKTARKLAKKLLDTADTLLKVAMQKPVMGKEDKKVAKEVGTNFKALTPLQKELVTVLRRLLGKYGCSSPVEKSGP